MITAVHEKPFTHHDSLAPTLRQPIVFHLVEQQRGHRAPLQQPRIAESVRRLMEDEK
jgi:hypothetical protein